MARYLDPKADVTFKKVFGEHKNLVISLLNALLPLDEGKRVESIEYLPPEMVPDNPDKKNSIVDVRCEETGGRKFIVEMQLNWTTAFKERVLFNAAKAYVRQIDRGEKYRLLQPVYSHNLVNCGHRRPHRPRSRRHRRALTTTSNQRPYRPMFGSVLEVDVEGFEPPTHSV